MPVGGGLPRRGGHGGGDSVHSDELVHVQVGFVLLPQFLHRLLLDLKCKTRAMLP